MRREYGRALRKQFRERMALSMPGFSIATLTDGVSPGSDLYQCRPRENLTLFVYLGIDSRRNAFTMEVGWSRNGRFPEREPFTSPDDQPKVNGTRFRLCNFWEKKRDPWWVVQPPMPTQELLRQMQEGILIEPPVEEYLPNITTTLDDVAAKLLHYAVPYFAKVVSEAK